MISSNMILPLSHVCVEVFEGSQQQGCCPHLIIAPMLTGTATANKLYQVASTDLANQLFGAGSIAADMAKYALATNRYGALYVIGQPDSGAKAKSDWTLSGTATGFGTITITIGGQKYRIDIQSGDVANTILARAQLAIIANGESLVIVERNSEIASFVAKNGGTTGNNIPVFLDTSEMPAGFTSAITPMAGGTGNALITQALSSIGACCFDFVSVPHNDADNLDILSNWIKSRWDCDNMIGGWFVSGFRGSYLDGWNFLGTRGADSDEEGGDKFGSYIHQCPDRETALHQNIAVFGALGHRSTCTAPQDPWHGLELTGITARQVSCDEQDCLTTEEANILAQRGMTVTKVGSNGVEEILSDRSAFNNSNSFYAYPQAAQQVLTVLRALKAFDETNYKSTTFVDDGTEIVSGSNMVNAQMMKAELKAFLRGFQERGIIENVDALADLIQIQRDPNNKRRVNRVIPIDASNPLSVIATTLQLRGA